MAWETRMRGGRYYTRSRRVNGRLVREYIGAGPVAEAAAALDAAKRAERGRLAALAPAVPPALSALDAQMAELSRRVQRVVSETLTQAGYHQHHRGAWRRRRSDGG